MYKEQDFFFFFFFCSQIFKSFLSSINITKLSFHNSFPTRRHRAQGCLCSVQLPMTCAIQGSIWTILPNPAYCALWGLLNIVTVLFCIEHFTIWSALAPKSSTQKFHEGLYSNTFRKSLYLDHWMLLGFPFE